MSLVDHDARGGVAVLTMDDATAERLSPPMLDPVGAALDQAESRRGRRRRPRRATR